MTLPDGFSWQPRWQYSTLADGLFLRGEMVAMLLDKVGGGWFARLDTQRGMDGTQVTRDCTSFEAGLLGCEIWARWHEARLRAEVDAKIGSRPPPRCCSQVIDPGCTLRRPME